MTREFIITQIFDKRWDELNLNDETLRQLQTHIMQNPSVGDIIEDTGGLIKLKWNLPNKGKRGGVRILYVDFIKQETVILINCYSKSEKDTLTSKEKAIYKEFIKEIGKGLRK